MLKASKVPLSLPTGILGMHCSDASIKGRTGNK